MKKVTDLSSNEVIHCPTKQNAKKICGLLDKAGLRWKLGGLYTNSNKWEVHMDNTCYCPAVGEYSRLAYYEGRGYTVCPASDFIEEELPDTWYIQITEYNRKMVKDWINVKNNAYICEIGWYYGLQNGKHSWLSTILPNTLTVLTDEEFQKYILKQQPEQMTTQIISRQALKEIDDIACNTWKRKIESYVKRTEPFSNNVSLSQEEVNEMFLAASSSQKEVLSKHLKQEKVFTSDMLKPGEIMEIDKSELGTSSCKYILRTYTNQVGFTSNGETDSRKTWNIEKKFQGKKLPSGTTITLKAK